TVLRCKVAVVGDATVGKTALLQVLKSNGHEYPKNYVMVTSDVELSTKSIAIPDTNVVVELYLFDCAGQSIFNQLNFGAVHVRPTALYPRTSSAFTAVGNWMLTGVVGILLANKTDLRDNNRDAVTTKDAKDFAERNDLKYFECSA
ncbi:hypothetical protein BBJ28_00010217, partial [Nothophytophthora sp. Chile5]